MKVELFYIAGCPNHRAAARLLRETLREWGLRDQVSEIEVTDSARAMALSFPGSPTIRIDGKDIEPTAPSEQQVGLSCRTYLVGGKLVGVPARETIRRAIRLATSVANVESKKE